jgi:hypothetical protein
MIALGTGGVKPCVSSFGAHRSNRESKAAYMQTKHHTIVHMKIKTMHAIVHMKIKTMPLKFYNLCTTQAHMYNQITFYP